MSAKPSTKTNVKPQFYTAKDSKEFLKEVVADRQKDKNNRRETFFFRHRNTDQVCWGTNDELREEMISFKKAKENRDLHINHLNNRVKMIGGQKWFILVVQQGASPAEIEPIGIDRLGFGFDDGMFLVDGMIYVFRHEANRDAVYKYIMGV
jgi:hypothetical protein